MMSESTKTAEAVAAPSYFSRKIGNTTFIVSVSFSEKGKDHFEDKIIRLIESDSQQREVSRCG